MPHTFTNRTRKFANFLCADPEQLGRQFRWERVNSWCYELGGILFVISSVLALPSLSNYKILSSELIIAASSFFLIVSLHDCVEFINLQKPIHRSDFIAVTLYIMGSCCLIHGAIYAFPRMPSERIGYVSFAGGSACFLIGTVLNSLYIFESPTRRTAQYFLLTAISFIIGSTMFFVGSTARFVLQYHDRRDSFAVNTFIAAFYIVGSVMFCLGGLFNALRFSIVMRRDVKAQEDKNPVKRLFSLLLDGSSSGYSYGAVSPDEKTADDAESADQNDANGEDTGNRETNYKEDTVRELGKADL